MGRADIARASALCVNTSKNVNAMMICKEVLFMTARDYIEFYQRFCEERNWCLTRAQWMQLNEIARSMSDLEYRRFWNSPEGVMFERILESLDKYSAIEALGIA